jgi:hypothetical protein
MESFPAGFPVTLNPQFSAVILNEQLAKAVEVHPGVDPYI